MKKPMCANCGRNETDKTVCDTCRASFPGDPALLEGMIEAFQTIQRDVPGFQSIATGVKRSSVQ